ncbi:MAG: hypothetical protein GY906_32690 [bacterium]|nr:hypothetical protein [bacterium]
MSGQSTNTAAHANQPYEFSGLARLELWLVLAITLHTLIVGLMLLVVPAWATKFGGWVDADPLFFTRQAGIFHVVLVCAYLLEYFRWRSVSMIVIAKSIAVVFLLGATLLDSVPWAVPVSAVLDGGMALVTFVLHSRVIKEHRSP